MMKIATNKPEFLNDIAEVLRVFLDVPEVILCEEDESGADLAVFFEQRGEDAKVNARVNLGEQTYCYTYQTRFSANTPLEQKRYEKRAVKIAVFRALKQGVTAYTPWGSLTGIRPTRLYRELKEAGGIGEADRMMLQEFDVSPAKLELVKEIDRVQAPVLASQKENDIDVYIGVPFCASRCLYCSFLSQVRTQKTDMGSYIDALKKDIALGANLAKEAGYAVRSMYFGGGTPTVLTKEELFEVLSFALSTYGTKGQELTVEAGRPDTIDREKLMVLKELGVDRICINPQTMNDETLNRIGRAHTAREIQDVFYLARELGFDHINMDLIAGLPGENLSHMKRTLDAIEALSPESLTVHTLAIKRSSTLKRYLEQYPLPDAETADGMVTLARERAEAMGMKPYYMYRQKYMRGNLENVGYAKDGAVCIYNVDMMEETTSIMAHGAGAMSKRIFGGEKRVERIPNPKDIGTYCSKIEQVYESKHRLFSD